MQEQKPFDGVRVIDMTHVLAGPFATYQLAVFGADVIKVESPDAPDQARFFGTSEALNRAGMGTGYLTQSAGKRAIALDLRRPAHRDALLRLVETADILVENYRPGALEALGLGHDVLAARNPTLIHASMSAFGDSGPRREQTAYDYVIQAASGLMQMTGTATTNPVKFGAPAVDYATGTMGAFALASALFQRQATGRGQRIDLAMMDVAMTLMASHVTGFTRAGVHPEPRGNITEHATSSAYPTRDGLLMLGASNMKQYRRLWRALGRPEVIQPDYEARLAAFEAEQALLHDCLAARTADEWEVFLQARGVPAARVRRMAEALEDPQLASRAGVYHHATDHGGYVVPVSPVRLAHGGADVSRPPPRIGEHTQAILHELGYSDAEIEALIAPPPPDGGPAAA